MPLIIRTLLTAVRAGVRRVHVIVGYDADGVRAAVMGGAPPGVDVSFHHNARWHEENGLSALVARPHVGVERFALLMGDHVFDWRVLEQMLHTDGASGESLLAIDREAVGSPRAAEATKVRLDGHRITAIGKQLMPFDALDTGVFVFSPAVFAALEESAAAGDTSLSGGVARLAARGLMRGIATDGSAWCDIDTLDDLEDARRIA